MAERSEGWTWIQNSPKWHYFRGGRSLCGKFMLLKDPEYEQGQDEHSQNCAACRRKRLEEQKEQSR